jgi:hypothetical protein
MKSPDHVGSRVDVLRREIAAAEAKLKRLQDSIAHRKLVLNRLEAAAVLNGDPVRGLRRDG